MAALPTTRLVPVEEYLNTSYSPEVEYVDGVLVERGMPSIAHSLLQTILGQALPSDGERLGFETLPNVRTRIIERACYRVPDVLLCPVPLPLGQLVTSIPWVVIEILSPSDALSQQIDRFQEFSNIGVLQIVLLDPEHFVAYRYEDGGVVRTRFTHLDLPTGALPFDTEALFKELVKRRNRGRN